MSEKRYVVRLSEEERQQLSGLVKKGRVAGRKRMHAHVLLKADQGDRGPRLTDEQVGEALDIHGSTVKAIRERFVEEGLAAALDRKKLPPRELKLDGEKEARLVAMACGTPPEGRVRWTLRLLADRMVELKIVESLSYETVRRTLKKTSSSPTGSNAG